MKTLVLLMLISTNYLYSTLSIASDFPNFPTSSILHNANGDRNSIEVNCKPNISRNTLRCKFYQMSLSYEVNPKKLEDVIKKEIDKMKKDKDYLGENPLKEIKKMCLTKGKEGERIKSHFNKMKAGAMKEHMRSVMSVMEQSCTANTLKKVNDIMVKMIKLQKQWSSVTCKIWPNSWEETFKIISNAGNQYWVSNPEPAGSCGVMNVSTLKKDGDYFWKYESRRVVTNKESTSSLLPCKKIDERSIVYSWKPKKHEVMCKELKFGF